MCKKLVYLISFVLVLGLAANASAKIESVDVGGPALAGSSSYNAGTDTWTVIGDGSDIWGNADDKFHFVFQPMAGNGIIEAEILSFNVADPWTKVGLMMRDSLAPGSKHAMFGLSGANGTHMVWRENTNQGSGHNTTYAAGFSFNT